MDARTGTGRKRGYVSRDKDTMSPSALLHSRTVVEKTDFVSTGVLTYVLGDLIEIEIAEYDVFHLGDEVKIISYTPAGITVFMSKVLAKELGSIMIFNPPDIQKKFGDKRSFPRVLIEQRGDLKALTDPYTKERQVLEFPLNIIVYNISTVGIGFTLHEPQLLQNEAQFHAELDIGFMLTCEAEIVRRDNSANGLFYGAKFLQVDQEASIALRGFILKKQLQAHFQAKRDEKKKRAFK